MLRTCTVALCGLLCALPQLANAQATRGPPTVDTPPAKIETTSPAPFRFRPLPPIPMKLSIRNKGCLASMPKDRQMSVDLWQPESADAEASLYWSTTYDIPDGIGVRLTVLDPKADGDLLDVAGPKEFEAGKPYPVDLWSIRPEPVTGQALKLYVKIICDPDDPAKNIVGEADIAYAPRGGSEQ